MLLNFTWAVRHRHPVAMGVSEGYGVPATTTPSLMASASSRPSEQVCAATRRTSSSSPTPLVARGEFTKRSVERGEGNRGADGPRSHATDRRQPAVGLHAQDVERGHGLMLLVLFLILLSAAPVLAFLTACAAGIFRVPAHRGDRLGARSESRHHRSGRDDRRWRPRRSAVPPSRSLRRVRRSRLLEHLRERRESRASVN